MGPFVFTRKIASGRLEIERAALKDLVDRDATLIVADDRNTIAMRQTRQRVVAIVEKNRRNL